MQTGIFGAPLIDNLNKREHKNYHGFVIVDGKLMNAHEFSRKLVTLADGSTICFVAIYGTQSIHKKVEWAKELTGEEIKEKLEGNNSLVAFTCDLQFSAKLTSGNDIVRNFIVQLFGDKAVFADSQCKDRVELDYNLSHACFMLDIVTEA
jgi:hypothetical protein